MANRHTHEVVRPIPGMVGLKTGDLVHSFTGLLPMVHYELPGEQRGTGFAMQSVFIGIGAVVLNGAVVEEGAQVGAGALVPPGKVPRMSPTFLRTLYHTLGTSLPLLESLIWKMIWDSPGLE